MSNQSPGVLEIDTSTPHPARIYDYLLGGKDNFPADRAAAEQLLALAPQTREMCRQNRAFLQRVVRFLVREAGIRQFLDIGTGIPTQGNVHEVAQTIAPDVRVVYVDNDPIVLSHSRALLACDRTTIIEADLREPDSILQHPRVLEFLDFDRPIAVMLVAILHFIADKDDPHGIVARLRDGIASGSYLAISHGSGEAVPEVASKVSEAYQRATSQLALRSLADIERFLEGFTLVDPGLVPISLWRPDGDIPKDREGFYGVVGRKP